MISLQHILIGQHADKMITARVYDLRAKYRKCQRLQIAFNAIDLCIVMIRPKCINVIQYSDSVHIKSHFVSQDYIILHCSQNIKWHFCKCIDFFFLHSFRSSAFPLLKHKKCRVLCCVPNVLRFALSNCTRTRKTMGSEVGVCNCNNFIYSPRLFDCLAVAMQ